MSDDRIETNTGETEEAENKPAPVKRKIFSLRNLLVAIGVTAFVVIVAAVVTVVLYRTGAFDTYIKNQFTAKMSDIGIAFDADTFRVAASPMTLVLRNATFRDKVTGENLFFIRNAELALSVVDLFSWKTTRDIRLDRSDISGAEVWVKFDQNGRSNFSNLKFVEQEKGSAVNFRYESAVFSLQDSVIHFGDLSRKIGAEAKNVTFNLSPIDGGQTSDTKRYNFDAGSTDSNFVYDTKTLDKISVRASGIVSDTDAEIKHLELRTPLGDSTLVGTVKDWTDPKYDLEIESSIDLTQATDIFASGTAITGIGNFKGHVTGTGENYHIEGTADSAAIRAAGVYLKAVNAAGTVEGTNTNYTANGKAVAAMLTFGDFQIDLPKMAGNVRGTGTDFRWVGELEAIAARSPSLTIGGLFLADAMAEYKDRKFRAEVGNGLAKRFAVGDLEFEELRARNIQFSTPAGGVDITAPSASTSALKAKDYRINGITGQNVRVKNSGGRTTVEADNLRSKNTEVHGTRLQDAQVSSLRYENTRGVNKLSTSNVRIGRIDAPIGKIDGVESPLATLESTAGGTVIYADKLRLAKTDLGSAVLGSLNIAGVRLTIREGTVEGRSNDIDAGNVTLTKSDQLPNEGTLNAVQVRRPVFVLEPAGRYRASADMSIGGGTVGSISLGSATAKVDVNNDRALIDQLKASVMDGHFNGTIAVALNDRTLSRVDADFADLDLSKLAALQSGRVIPVTGNTSGNAHLTFQGRDYRTTTGKLSATIFAAAGKDDTDRIPISGDIELAANLGLFDVTKAKLRTDKSDLSVTGRFDLRNESSDLKVALRSTDADEIARLVRVTGFSQELDQQLDSLQVEFAGKLDFDGTLTGNLYDPNIVGNASLERIIMRRHTLGSVTTALVVDHAGVELKDGKLNEIKGGRADFNVMIPRSVPNGVAVKATLDKVDAGNLLAALPVDLPERLSDLTGQASGTVNINGLPNNAQGEINLAAAKGVIAGQNFDNLKAKAVFQGTRVDLEYGEIRVGDGAVSAKGTYDRQTTAFDMNVTGKAVPLPLALAFLPKNDSIPAIDGAVDITAKAVGQSNNTATFDVAFNGTARNVTIGGSQFGEVTFDGVTANKLLTANLTATLGGRDQVIKAKLDLSDEKLPFSVSTRFDQSALEPYLAFVPQLKSLQITGVGTGNIDFGGELRGRDSKGAYFYTTSNLKGVAEFTELAIKLQDTPLAAAEPIKLRFSTREVEFESARFSGGGSNMTISGTKALVDDAVNNLAVDGRINLSLLNLAKTDVFFGGVADVKVRLTGQNASSQLSGTATTDNASVATFIGSDRLTFDRIKTQVVLSSNHAEVEDASGVLSGGKFNGSGEAVLDGLSVRSFRFVVNGDNVTVPLPKDFKTTGDARLEISGITKNRNENLQITISGRVFAKRSIYSKDIELSNIISGRRDTTLSGGSSALSPPRFDLTIEGRDALVVKNNIADLTASVSLVLTGDANNPQLSGRITANSGTLFYKKDRYEVQRGVLEFPPNTAIEPNIDLQAETEIGGYQIFINLAGPLNDSEQLTATVRSTPSLPQADVVSLITTGSLTNSAGGIPTLAQTGINTAAEILTDSIFNNPARKATDKLFGLNVFEIDPIISGRQLNPSARLTVGRQINNNLRVTYSTNLSQDQNQVLAVEYRLSNKLSFVAQYEQRSLTNVTRNRENFSFEVRFRKRF